MSHDDDSAEPAETGISEAPPAGARLAAWGTLSVTEASVAVAGWALVACGLPWQLLLTSYAVTNGWMAATFAPFGTLVARRRPRLAVGWLFCGFALCYGLSAAAISLAMWKATAGGPNHWSSTLGWLGVFIWTPAVAVFFPLIVLLFPDGHLPGRRWRWLAGLALADGVVWLLGGAFDPNAVSGMPFVAYRTVAVSGAWGRLAHTADYVGNILVESVGLACLAVLMWRWQRSTGSQRAQLSWLVVGATIAVGLFAPTAVNVSTVWSTALLIGVPALPAAAAVAVLRHRLLGIDVVINRTLVYVGLSATLLACFLAVVELASVIVGHNAGLGASLAGAAVVAIAFSPVRQFLQRRVDTLVFGYRRDPSQALSQVTAQLLSDTDDEVEASLRAVSNSLRLPGLALVRGGRCIGPAVSVDGTETVIPLRYRSEAVGQLLVKPRRGQAALDASDLAALELVAAPIAAAVYALRLTEQLQRAQEEERRRLHRDLHDGLGPMLTAMALRADAAGNVSRTDQAKAHTLIGEVADQARQAIDEVRRISHDLRPRGLERLGLLDALAREASRFGSHLDGGALIVTAELPETVPPLSAEVEDGAFQITAEALTNIARHSDATAAVLRVYIDRSLHIEILDNGTADPGGWTEGFGIASMRDRAAGAGGTLEAGPTSTGGRVCATPHMPGHPGELVVITLLIVDDHPVVRDGLAALIDTVDNVAVIAQADTAERAIRAAHAHRPDVVLMDLNLPGASGIYATRRITQALPGTAVLVLTMSEDDESILAAIRAGAKGYLLKGARQQEILNAIETVASGGALFSPHAARHLLAQLSRTPESRDVVPPFPELTVRERQVLELVGDGLRNHAVAQRLGISQKTVANYLSGIFVKLHVEDRAQAILLARQAGLAVNPDKPRP